MHELFGEPIHTYTRAQALSDGTLVDLSDWASAEKGFFGGFCWPLAVTAAVWNDLGDIPEWAQGSQDVRGRAHDLLWMASLAVRQEKGNATEVLFDVILALAGDPAPADMGDAGEEHSVRTYKLVCGPNDDGTPCLTVMRPEED